jgi:uncharacterized protein (TIGR03000 family)
MHRVWKPVAAAVVFATGLWPMVAGGRAGAADAPAAAGRPAAFEVRAPADAEIWFDDAKTSSTGVLRRFVSPPLAVGREFSYTVRVRWEEDGRPVERTQHLAVHAGDRIALDYSGGAAAGMGISAAAFEVESTGPERTTSFYPPAGAPVAPAAAGFRPAPAVPATVEFRPAPSAPPRYYDPGPPAGPPGSNDPMSLGVGNG